jgi:hypothetical protein
MIRHIVPFRLKHAKGSPEEADFLEALAKLADIPGVLNLQVMPQVSPKNDFTYGVSMEFASNETYQAYNEHPDHVAFVQGRWVPEVVAFMEIDFEY